MNFYLNKLSKIKTAYKIIKVLVYWKILRLPIIGNYNLDTRKFYDEYASKYQEFEINYAFDYHKARKVFIETFLEKANHPILDIGCGVGVYNADYGIDLSEVVLKKRVGLSIVAHTSFLPLKNNSVNTVIMSEILEHMNKNLAEKAIKEAYRVCSGQIIITTPGYTKHKPLVASEDMQLSLKRSGIDKTEYIHTGYRPNEIRLLCEKSGFSTVDCGEISPCNIYYIGINQSKIYSN